MAKGAAKDAFQNVGTANQNAGTFSGNANSAWNAAFPQLQTNATNPTGYTQGQLASMNTANSQSVGGGQAAAVGQGNLMAGRTRNTGAFGAALDASARNAGKQLSQNAVGIQTQNAQLAQQKQQDALHQLGQLYGQNVSGLNDMLNASNNAIGQATNADNSTDSLYENIGNDAMKMAMPWNVAGAEAATGQSLSGMV
jgi:hypothetical protein